MDELFGEQDAAGLGDGDGRGAQVLAELAPQLAFADAQAFGQGVDAGVVQGAKFDLGQGARDAVGQVLAGACLLYTSPSPRD